MPHRSRVSSTARTAQRGIIQRAAQVTYQTALATHAKRDEQLRTAGTLLVRILK
jgi:hypothetical protein